jgi:glucokinase
VLFVAIGTGIAAAYIVDGAGFAGAHGAAGEIGHIVVRPGGPVCGCGNRGCLEAVASAAAVARRYAEAAAHADHFPAESPIGHADHLPAGSPIGHADHLPAGSPIGHADHLPAGSATGQPDINPAGPATGQPGTNPAGPAAGQSDVTAARVAERAAAGDPVARRVWQETIDALADGLLTGLALFDPEVVVVGGGLAEAGGSLLDPLRDALRARLTFHREPSLVRAALGDEAGCLGAALLALDLRGDG